MWFNRNKKINEAVKISPIDDLTMTGAIKFSDVQNPHNQPKPIIEVLSIKAFFLSQYSLFNSLSSFKKFFWSILYTWKFIATEKISFFRFCLISLFMCFLCSIPIIIGLIMIDPADTASNTIPEHLQIPLRFWANKFCKIEITKCEHDINQFVSLPEGLRKNIYIVYLVVKKMIGFLLPVIIYSIIFIIYFSIPILILIYNRTKIELLLGYLIFFLLLKLVAFCFLLDWEQPFFVYDSNTSIDLNSKEFESIAEAAANCKHPGIAYGIHTQIMTEIASHPDKKDQYDLMMAALNNKPVPQPQPPQLTFLQEISNNLKRIFQFNSDKSNMPAMGTSKRVYDPSLIKFCKSYRSVRDTLYHYVLINEEKARLHAIMHNNIKESYEKWIEIRKDSNLLMRSYDTFKLGKKSTEVGQEFYYKGTWMERIWGGFKVWYLFEYPKYKFPLFSKKLENAQTLFEWIFKIVHSSPTYDLKGVAFSWGRFWDGVVIVIKDVSTLKNWPIMVQNFCNYYLNEVKLVKTSVDGVLSEYQQTYEHLIQMLKIILLDYANYHRFVLNNQGTAFFLTALAESLDGILEVEKLIVSIFYFFLICFIYLICIPGAILLLSNLMSRLLDKSVFSKKTTDLSKSSAYECGFQPFSDSRNKIDIRFYLVAILFIIFDLEIMFLFPWSLALSSLTAMGFVSMFCFLLILTLGFFYEWKKKALDW